MAATQNDRLAKVLRRSRAASGARFGGDVPAPSAADQYLSMVDGKFKDFSSWLSSLGAPKDQPVYDQIMGVWPHLSMAWDAFKTDYWTHTPSDRATWKFMAEDFYTQLVELDRKGTAAFPTTPPPTFGDDTTFRVDQLVKTTNDGFAQMNDWLKLVGAVSKPSPEATNFLQIWNTLGQGWIAFRSDYMSQPEPVRNTLEYLAKDFLARLQDTSAQANTVFKGQRAPTFGEDVSGWGVLFGAEPTPSAIQRSNELLHQIDTDFTQFESWMKDLDVATQDPSVPVVPQEAVLDGSGNMVLIDSESAATGIPVAPTSRRQAFRDFKTDWDALKQGWQAFRKDYLKTASSGRPQLEKIEKDFLTRIRKMATRAADQYPSLPSPSFGGDHVDQFRTFFGADASKASIKRCDELLQEIRNDYNQFESWMRDLDSYSADPAQPVAAIGPRVLDGSGNYVSLGAPVFGPPQAVPPSARRQAFLDFKEDWDLIKGGWLAFEKDYLKTPSAGRPQLEKIEKDFLSRIRKMADRAGTDFPSLPAPSFGDVLFGAAPSPAKATKEDIKRADDLMQQVRSNCGQLESWMKDLDVFTADAPQPPSMIQALNGSGNVVSLGPQPFYQTPGDASQVSPRRQAFLNFREDWDLIKDGWVAFQKDYLKTPAAGRPQLEKIIKDFLSKIKSFADSAADKWPSLPAPSFGYAPRFGADAPAASGVLPGSSNSASDPPPPYPTSWAHFTPSDVQAYAKWLDERVDRFMTYYLNPDNNPMDSTAPGQASPQHDARQQLILSYENWVNKWRLWKSARDGSVIPYFATSYDDVRDWHNQLVSMVVQGEKLGFKNQPPLSGLPDNQVLPSPADARHAIGDSTSTLMDIALVAAAGIGGFFLLEAFKGHK